MKRIQKDENTVLVDTGEIKLVGYPPTETTFVYVVKLYEEIKHTPEGVVITVVEGEPIFVHDMPPLMRSLVDIYGSAHAALRREISKYDGYEPK